MTLSDLVGEEPSYHVAKITGFRRPYCDVVGCEERAKYFVSPNNDYEMPLYLCLHCLKIFIKESEMKCRS